LAWSTTPAIGSRGDPRSLLDGGPPRHTHTREDESFYLLTGALEVECGDDRFQAGPGSFVFLPRNLPHVFRSVGGPATALLVVTPGGLDEHFAELPAALAANADAARVRTIQRAYGIARGPRGRAVTGARHPAP
jgi:Cupin domain